MDQKKEALRLIEEVLKELDSSRSSILSAVQKLHLASGIIGKRDIEIWCEIQLGDAKYTVHLKKFVQFIIDNIDEKPKKYVDDLDQYIKLLTDLNLKQDLHYSIEEINVKAPKSGGSYQNIGFIEEKYADLVRTKCSTDGTYYKNNLNKHINYVRRKTHEFASILFRQLKFSGTVSNCFDLLKNAVDDRLLDLNPILAEQLMLAFKALSSEKNEEWSQALTTCRRLLEGLADELYPASSEQTKGRSLGQQQYINRLWAFMDESIKSESNKDLAKAHVDFLGSWMEKVNRLSNKGVHAEVEKLESVKAIFHTYLVISDILEYLDSSQKPNQKPDINTATIDELEALLNISRSLAKEIIKVRVHEGHIDIDLLSKIRGIGPKILQKATEAFIV